MRPSFSELATLNGNTPNTTAQIFLMIADTVFDMAVVGVIASITALASGALASAVGGVAGVIGLGIAIYLLVVQINEANKRRRKYRRGDFDWQGDNLLANETFYFDALEMSNLCDGMLKNIHYATQDNINLFEYMKSFQTEQPFEHYAKQPENVNQSRYHPKLLEGVIDANLKLTNGIHNYLFTQSIPKTNYPS
jgi:hypothetical protein